MEYLKTTESEYRTIYRSGKWTSTGNDHSSDFYSGEPEGAMTLLIETKAVATKIQTVVVEDKEVMA